MPLSPQREKFAPAILLHHSRAMRKCPVFLQQSRSLREGMEMNAGWRRQRSHLECSKESGYGRRCTRVVHNRMKNSRPFRLKTSGLGAADFYNPFHENR
jgi:hypothetical protein